MHAYMIMAHGNLEQLKKLLKLLDDRRNEIFLHMDKAGSIPDSAFDGLLSYAKMTLIPRKNVRWAHYSQVDVELDLLEAALKSGGNNRFHLLSGMDLPLKTQDEIHDFFAGTDDEIIGICGLGDTSYHKDHVQYYYPLLKIKAFRKSRFLKVLNEFGILLQKLCFVNKLRGGKSIVWVDGWTFFSITKSFAEYILQHREWIEKTFRYAKAPDEMAFHTLAYNSEFRHKIHCFESGSLEKMSLRKIPMERGRPYLWYRSDYDELMNSSCLFARKFDENADSEIIDRIFDCLSAEQRGC